MKTNKQRGQAGNINENKQTTRSSCFDFNPEMKTNEASLSRVRPLLMILFLPADIRGPQTAFDAGK